MKKNSAFLLMGILALAVGFFISYRPTPGGPDPVPGPEDTRRTSSMTPQTPSGKSGDRSEAKTSSSSGVEGSLSVTSNPSGATLYIDGRKFGVTPLTVPGLKQGAYTIRILRLYHEPHEEKVEIRRGERIEKHLELERGKGILSIVAKPVSASVYLNGVKQKRPTPLRVEGLISGLHRVRVEADRYRGQERGVEILPGETTEALFVLEGGNLEYYRDEWHEPEVARKMKEEDVGGLLAKARAASSAGDFAAALRLLEQAASILPGSGAVMESVDLVKTLEADRQRRLDQERAERLLNKGKVLESEAKYEEALAMYKEARTICPDFEGLGPIIARLEDKVRQLTEYRLTGGMVLVPGGFFMMGCSSWAGDCEEDAYPVHRVELDAFYLGKYEVTQRQWKELMNDNPSHHRGCEDCPVESVGWNDIQEFIRRLNKATNKRYRLPTEAEWEYAARGGGKPEKWSGTSNPEKLEDYAWYWKNSGQRARLVGTRLPNGLGLYDMTGNVDEWCSDVYTAIYYRSSTTKNPAGPKSSPFRVIRGGNWNHPGDEIRTVIRYHVTQGARHNGLGFRLALSKDG